MLDYHDHEWGFPVADDRRLFEKVCLEGFQSGLSWRTILVKRENFRAAFAGFDFGQVAGYGPADVERLYRICALRDLGLGLPAIRGVLDGEPASLADVLASHLDELDRRIEQATGLRRRVAALVRTDPTTDDLIHLLEAMAMQQSTLERRISILVYEDLEAMHAYLARVFGLVPGELTRDPSGAVVHAELEAGDGVIWLHAESAEFGLASPKNLGAATATMAVLVDDVDAHHAAAVAEGANVRYEPVDQPYGYREYGAIDPEGTLWSFMKPLA